ncbi:MAG: ABC transporter substrate-binding protein [Oscillospiraceae bacterium]|nr:ABC transporter substrate-binding protein [Oscillospiraceae bacterium]
MKKILICLLCCSMFFFSGCSRTQNTDSSKNEHTVTGKMELKYAEQFSADRCSDGCSIISTGGEKYLLVPSENNDENHGTSCGMTVIRQPENNIYLAASSAMDFFDELGLLDRIKFTSTSAENWSLENVKKAVSNEDIFYVGKYSAPDYEFLLSEGCSLAVESTMINHNPEVREQLIRLGIPVITERSSYESHPMGRTEWIKLYGLILDKEEEAEAFFEEKLETFRKVSEEVPENAIEEKTTVFFYITSNGYVNVRKPGDYISRMISLAGGKYIFTDKDLNTNANELSTMNMQMEDFYLKAKDADFIIYNSAIDGAIETREQLISKSELFRDFKAVRENNVWCTGQNMFQKTSGTADMIADIKQMFSDENKSGEYNFIRHVK